MELQTLATGHFGAWETRKPKGRGWDCSIWGQKMFTNEAGSISNREETILTKVGKWRIKAGKLVNGLTAGSVLIKMFAL